MNGFLGRPVLFDGKPTGTGQGAKAKVLLGFWSTVWRELCRRQLSSSTYMQPHGPKTIAITEGFNVDCMLNRACRRCGASRALGNWSLAIPTSDILHVLQVLPESAS